jgi:hypothetical protein
LWSAWWNYFMPSLQRHWRTKKPEKNNPSVGFPSYFRCFSSSLPNTIGSSKVDCAVTNFRKMSTDPIESRLALLFTKKISGIRSINFFYGWCLVRMAPSAVKSVDLLRLPALASVHSFPNVEDKPCLTTQLSPIRLLL